MNSRRSSRRSSRPSRRASSGSTVDVLFEKAGRKPGQIVGRSPYLQPGAGRSARRLHHRQHRPCPNHGSQAQTRLDRRTGRLAPYIGSACGRVIPGTHERRTARLKDPRAARPAAATFWLRRTMTRPRPKSTLSFDDNRLASRLFGQYDQNLACLEKRLGIRATARGNLVNLDRSGRPPASRPSVVLENLYARLKSGHDVDLGDVDGAIRMSTSQGSLFEADGAAAPRPRGNRHAASARCAPAPRRRTPISAR